MLEKRSDLESLRDASAPERSGVDLTVVITLPVCQLEPKTSPRPGAFDRGKKAFQGKPNADRSQYLVMKWVRNVLVHTDL